MARGAIRYKAVPEVTGDPSAGEEFVPAGRRKRKRMKPPGPGLRVAKPGEAGPVGGSKQIILDRVAGDPACRLCRGLGTRGKANRLTGLYKECRCISEEAKAAKIAEVEAFNKNVDARRKINVLVGEKALEAQREAAKDQAQTT